MAAIKDDGTLWTWGNNTFGSCGYDSKNQDFIEEPVKVLDDVKMVWMDEVRFEKAKPLLRMQVPKKLMITTIHMLPLRRKKTAHYMHAASM